MSFNSKYTGLQIEDLLDKVDKGSVGEGGYPVVTVTDDFNIEALPNTFYNIKNEPDSEIFLNIKDEELYIEDLNKYTMFTFDDWDEFLTAENQDMIMVVKSYLALFGGKIIPDTSKEGYFYRIDIDLAKLSGDTTTGLLKYYFSGEIKTGNSINTFIDATSLGITEELIYQLNNINIISDNSEYIIIVTVNGELYNTPHLLIELENDNLNFLHKYEIFGLISINGCNYCYTTEPIPYAENFYINESSSSENMMDLTELVDKFTILPNKNIKGGNIANEFVFNFNTPVNILINQDIKWNNNIEPDLTQSGICTISLLNGVGCFTFI